MDKCVFWPVCEKLTEKRTCTLTAKGCAGIETASKKRGTEIHVVPGQEVHVECRKVFCNPINIELFLKQSEGTSARTAKRLRSGESLFSYKDNCLFCGQPDPYIGKKGRYKLIPVRTFDFQENILQVCNDRSHDQSDEWAEKVRDRIIFAQDLPAADAVYHRVCDGNFRSHKNIPRCFISDEDAYGKTPKQGRPKDSIRTEAFLNTMGYLEEQDDEEITIQSLCKKMQEFIGDYDCDAYSFTYMKQQVQEHFGTRIVITEINGVPNVVTFRETATSLLHRFYNQTKESDSDKEKLRLITIAAELIKSDIKSVTQERDVYPTSLEMESTDETNAFLPESLRLLLDTLFVGNHKELRTGSLGQAIMQATRPRVLIPPVQLGLGVQLHSRFASKYLIDTLYRHGVCCSYWEVQMFQRNASAFCGKLMDELFPGHFVQYSADNVDHDVCTLDGKNTFHGMGIIASVTPPIKQQSVIPRVSVTSEDIARVGRINIKPYMDACGGMNQMSYDKLPDVHSEDIYSKVNLLWKVSLSVQSPRPAWSGYMQMIHKGDHPGKASILFLPMIDLNPSDLTCINSTLHFVCEHAKRFDVTPVLTFDQPLWWKAVCITQNSQEDSELRSIVLRLGGFHTLMSFLGCIGHLMEGTGLKEMLSLVYAENTTAHMLTGKAVARALRGHLLVDAALNTFLALQAFGTAGGEDTDADIPPQLRESRELFDDLVAGTVSVEEVNSSEVLDSIQKKLNQEKESLKDHKTAQLWFQYLEMVEIVRDFLTSERTGDWELNLQAMQKMLPYLAASGHNLYTKSLYVYLQLMIDLPKQHPDIHQKFVNGLHVVRRSDRFWAGLSADQIIEQVLMRNLKTSGGLTRGRGMTETQRLVWVMSAPVCAEINEALDGLTNVALTTSEQHKDTSKARQERDSKDTVAIMDYLKERNPFTRDHELLISIANGISAESKVNVNKTKEVGKKILENMSGKPVLSYSFRKKNQAITMGSRSAVKIGDDQVTIDPQLLFQRLVFVATQIGQLEEAFKYELCSFPSALFEAKSVLLEANKSVLKKAMLDLIPVDEKPKEEHKFVLDGGALLHRIPWQLGESYDSILSRYCNYVIKRYGRAVVVFDGYLDGPSTKDVAHDRRAKGKCGRKVTFQGSMALQMKKDDFLENVENKARFLKLLGEKLEGSGCDVSFARADADLLIVETAVKMSENTDVVLVGDDTDLLVLLCHHAKKGAHDTFFMSEPKQTCTQPRRYVNIQTLKDKLGKTVGNHILFAHAFLGCDTTSRVYGIGKAVSLKMLKEENTDFVREAQVFRNPNSNAKDIAQAGEKAMVAIYKGKPSDNLDSIRFQKFRKKLSTSKTVVHPRVIPPTSDANKLHSYRVYHQVQQWQGNDLDPEKWGWKIVNGKMVPIQTELSAAPQSLLELIRCGCKTGCNDLRCGCRKQGLSCTLACTACRGVCANTDNGGEDSDEDSI